MKLKDSACNIDVKSAHNFSDAIIFLGVIPRQRGKEIKKPVYAQRFKSQNPHPLIQAYPVYQNRIYFEAVVNFMRFYNLKLK